MLTLEVAGEPVSVPMDEIVYSAVDLDPGRASSGPKFELVPTTGQAASISLPLVLDRFLQSLLFGIETTDPLTLATVVVVMLSSGALATWLPTRRAVRVDPVAALRSE